MRGDSKAWQQAITLLTVGGDAGQCHIVPSATVIGIMSLEAVGGDTGQHHVVPSAITTSYSHLEPRPVSVKTG